MNKRTLGLTLAAFVGLAILLLAELVLPYDVLARRLALAFTNVVSAALLAWFLFVPAVRKDPSGLHPAVAWSVALGVAFDAFGNFFLLYGRFAWWDQLAHAVGSAAAALAVFLVVRVLRSSGGRSFGDGVASVLVVGAAMTLATTYEIVEYLGDLAFKTRRVTDLFDTADDLLWDMLAIVLVTLTAMWITRLSVARKRSITV